MLEFGGITAQKALRNGWRTCKWVNVSHKDVSHTVSFYDNFSGENNMALLFLHILEAVCSCHNPTGWNERTTTQKPGALMKNGSNPWVRLYGNERTTHNFIHPPLISFTTRPFWRDTEDAVVRNNEGKIPWWHREWVDLRINLPVSTGRRVLSVGFSVVFTGGLEPALEQKMIYSIQCLIPHKYQVINKYTFTVSDLHLGILQNCLTIFQSFRT